MKAVEVRVLSWAPALRDTVDFLDNAKSLPRPHCEVGAGFSAIFFNPNGSIPAGVVHKALCGGIDDPVVVVAHAYDRGGGDVLPFRCAPLAFVVFQF